MNVKLSLVSALSLVALTVAADPAPVADLSRSSGVQSAARTGSVSERLSELERVVDARAQSQLQMQQQLESLMNEVSELRGTTEEQSYKLEQILQQQRDIYQEIDRRLGGGASPSQSAGSANSTQTQVPAGNPAAVVAADQVATTESAPAPAEPAEPALSEDDAFKQIQAFVSEKKYPQAIKALNAFNKNFPESANLPRSYYMLGLLHQQGGATKKAKASFDVVYKNYPNSDRAPLALYKLGMIAGEQDDAAGQKKYFNLLIKSYPKSKQAADARKALDKK